MNKKKDFWPNAMGFVIILALVMYCAMILGFALVFGSSIKSMECKLLLRDDCAADNSIHSWVHTTIGHELNQRDYISYNDVALECVEYKEGVFDVVVDGNFLMQITLNSTIWDTTNISVDGRHTELFPVCTKKILVIE